MTETPGSSGKAPRPVPRMHHAQMFVMAREHRRMPCIVKCVDLGLRISLPQRLAAAGSDHVGVGLRNEHAPMPALQVLRRELVPTMVIMLNQYVCKDIRRLLSLMS